MQKGAIAAFVLGGLFSAAAACSSDPTEPDGSPFGGAAASPGAVAGAAGSNQAGGSNGGNSSGGSSSGGNTGSGGDGGSGVAAGGAAGSAGSTAAAGAGGQSGSTGGTTSVPDAGGPDVTFSYVPPVLVQDACAQVTLEAEEITETVTVTVDVPGSVYIMLDKSGSMCPVFGGCGGSSKWAQAVSAITAFANDPASAGLKVALEYFSGNGCTGYETPTVPMGALPGNAANIVNSLNSTTPSGNTPTAGALNGMIQFCQTYMAANPTETCAGVLITDGDPTSCSPQDATGLGAIANTACTAPTNPVLVFTMGMQGATFSTLNTIAAQGCTDCDPAGPDNACDARNGSASFLAALQVIRSQITTTTTMTTTTTLDCEFAIPTSDAGIVDTNAIEVVFDDPPAIPEVLPKQPVEASCGLGWYFDNPGAPTRIKLCPSTCTAVQASTTGTIRIQLPCQGA